MSSSYIQIADDGSGKKLDTENITVGANSVHRERMQIAGAVAAAIAGILNTDPTGSEYAMLFRAVEVNDPQSSSDSDAAVAAGGTATIDSTQISSGKTAKLMRLIVSSSVPFKVQFQTVTNAAATTRITRFVGAERAWDFIPPSKEMYTVAQDAGAGFDGFRAVVTNLETSQPADMHAAFMWDEV